ncbi:hypothetical protein [Agromyces badenianii]|nr:hypothetical protein [Agromyces badenianii]
MLPRILGWAIVLGTAVVALVFVWPQGFGLQIRRAQSRAGASFSRQVRL